MGNIRRITRRLRSRICERCKKLLVAWCMNWNLSGLVERYSYRPVYVRCSRPSSRCPIYLDPRDILNLKTHVKGTWDIECSCVNTQLYSQDGPRFTRPIARWSRSRLHFDQHHLQKLISYLKVTDLSAVCGPGIYPRCS